MMGDHSDLMDCLHFAQRILDAEDDDEPFPRAFVQQICRLSHELLEAFMASEVAHRSYHGLTSTKRDSVKVRVCFA